MAKINKLTVHITASNDNATVEDIRKIHKANGWSDIGYHWLVDRKGNILQGRPENLTGAHVAGHNTGNIGISYIARGSDNDSDGITGEYMTPEQYEGLCQIVATICVKYDLAITDIYGHNEFPNVYKACPCFKVKKATKFLDRIKELMSNIPKNIDDIPEQAESVDGIDADGDELAHKAIRSND